MISRQVETHQLPVTLTRSMTYWCRVLTKCISFCWSSNRCLLWAPSPPPFYTAMDQTHEFNFPSILQSYTYRGKMLNTWNVKYAKLLFQSSALMRQEELNLPSPTAGLVKCMLCTFHLHQKCHHLHQKKGQSCKDHSMIDSYVIIALQMFSYDQMKKQIQSKTGLQFLWTSIWSLHNHKDFQNSGKIKVMWSQVFKYTWLYCLIALLSIISSSGHATCAMPSSWFISQTSNQFHCPLWNQLYWNQPT